MQYIQRKCSGVINLWTTEIWHYRAWQQKILKHELTKGEMEEKNENIKEMSFTEGKYKGD